MYCLTSGMAFFSQEYSLLLFHCAHVVFRSSLHARLQIRCVRPSQWSANLLAFQGHTVTFSLARRCRCGSCCPLPREPTEIAAKAITKAVLLFWCLAHLGLAKVVFA